MKKILTITLLVLLTVGLFVSCNGDAVETVFGSQDSPVCFTALTNNSEVKLGIFYLPNEQKYDDYHDFPKVVNFLYSTDNSTWADYTIGTPITLAKANDKVYFKAKEKVSGLNGFNEYYHFTGNGELSVEGNIMYLLDPSGETTTMTKCAFTRLFLNNTVLVSAKGLLLPATKMDKSCYYEMFRGCSALTEGPELKATVLAEDCYHAMFAECSSLKIAPELPAKTLATCCYDSMFWNCTSLTTAPVLPANTLVSRCYYNMFKGCTSLNSVTMLATDISATECLTDWLDGITSPGTLKVANDSMKTALTNDSFRPANWTVEVNP